MIGVIPTQRDTVVCVMKAPACRCSSRRDQSDCCDDSACVSKNATANTLFLLGRREHHDDRLRGDNTDDYDSQRYGNQGQYRQRLRGRGGDERRRAASGGSLRRPRNAMRSYYRRRRGRHKPSASGLL